MLLSLPARDFHYRESSFPQDWRRRSDRFPGLRKRELVSTSRKFLVDVTGFQSAALKPTHPFPSSDGGVDRDFKQGIYDVR
jgi:hypothetical protein